VVHGNFGVVELLKLVLNGKNIWKLVMKENKSKEKRIGH
jgi:hypothetical protein